MLEMISQFAQDFTRIDSQSMTILLVMVGWSTLLVLTGVESKMFTALFIPGMVLGGLAAFYVARLYMLSLSGAKDLNAIMLSAIGISAGFVLTLLAIRLVHWIADMRRPVTTDTRF
jgi:hypothetical protein